MTMDWSTAVYRHILYINIRDSIDRDNIYR